MIYFLFIFSLTLSSITFSTDFGLLSFSLVALILYGLIVLPRLTTFNNNSLFPLSISVWISISSIFSGSSIIGNLVNIWSNTFCAATLKKLAPYQKFLIAKSINLTIYIHSFFVLLDFLFDVPWGWDSDVFYLSFSAENFSRARGLFVEPSFLGLTISCLVFSLYLLNSLSLSPLLTAFVCVCLAQTVAGVLFILIFLFLVSFTQNKPFNLYSKYYLSFLSLRVILLLFISIAIISLASINSTASRILNPLSDNSILERTIGSTLFFQQVYRDSPLLGYGPGGKNQEQKLTDTQNSLSMAELGHCGAKGGTLYQQTGCVDVINQTSTNAIVSLFSFGGLPALASFLLYTFKGFHSSFKKSFLYFVILCLSAQIFNPLVFLLPALSYISSDS